MDNRVHGSRIVCGSTKRGVWGGKKADGVGGRAEAEIERTGQPGNNSKQNVKRAPIVGCGGAVGAN